MPEAFISVAKKKMPIEKTNQIASVTKSKFLVFSQCCACFDIFFPPYRLKEMTLLILKFIGTPKNATIILIFWFAGRQEKIDEEFGFTEREDD